MSDTVLRIVPNRFGNKPVRLNAEHPLYAQSVAPEDFAPPQESQEVSGDGTGTALPPIESKQSAEPTVEGEPEVIEDAPQASEGEPDETPVTSASRQRRRRAEQ